MVGSSSTQRSSIYDFIVKDSQGNDVDLSVYKGKVLLIINVASPFGLTNPNYTELNEVYTKYKDQGLEILAFSNQFGGQEQIAEMAFTDFPIFDKVEVNGNYAAPLRKFLKSSKRPLFRGGIEWLFGEGIVWNFTKFLVDKDGNVVKRYMKATPQLTIEKDVKKQLEIA